MIYFQNLDTFNNNRQEEFFMVPNFIHELVVSYIDTQYKNVDSDEVLNQKDVAVIWLEKDLTKLYERVLKKHRLTDKDISFIFQHNDGESNDHVRLANMAKKSGLVLEAGVIPEKLISAYDVIFNWITTTHQIVDWKNAVYSALKEKSDLWFIKNI